MSDGAAREMTLDEWCASLPANHRARIELDATRAELAAAVEALRETRAQLKIAGDADASVEAHTAIRIAESVVGRVLASLPDAAKARDRALRIEGAEAALAERDKAPNGGWWANMRREIAARIVAERFPTGKEGGTK